MTDVGKRILAGVSSREALDAVIRELRGRLLAGGGGRRMRRVRDRLSELIRDRIDRFGEPTLGREDLGIARGVRVVEVLRAGPEQYKILLDETQIGKVEIVGSAMVVYYQEHTGRRLLDVGTAGVGFLTDSERDRFLKYAVGTVLTYNTRIVEKNAARLAGSLPDEAE